MLKKSIWKLLNALHLGWMVQLALKSYLKDIGWMRSFELKKSVDAKGNPIPWLSYPFIHFLELRLHKGLSLYEFGSGNSTLWFASRLQQVHSVEHHKEWYDYVKNLLPANATLSYIELQYDGAYCRSANNHHMLFDIILVDGRDRVNCIRNSISALSAGGVVILDNSNVPAYAPALVFMQEQGFRKIDFTGMSPGSAHETQTTIFYRDHNCFNI